MRPVLFILENVMRMEEGETGGDFTQVSAFLEAELNDGGGPPYNLKILKNVDPIHSGYCEHRSRILWCGGRSDQVSEANLSRCLSLVYAQPMPVTMQYPAFLGMPPPLDFARLHCLPDAFEQNAIAESLCLCGVNPFAVCPVHKCKCEKCKKGLVCIWRKEAATFIENNFPGASDPEHMWAKELTYMHVVEIVNKKDPGALRG